MLGALLGHLALAHLDLEAPVGRLQLCRALGDRALQRVARFLQRFARRVLGADVVVDPDRALVRPRRIDRLADQLAPEKAAVLAPVLPLDRDRLALLHLLVEGGVVLPGGRVGIDGFGAAGDELARLVAEHLLETRIAALVGAVPEEGDADRGVVEDELLLGERALHAQVGLALGGDVLEAPDPLLLGLTQVGAPAARAAAEGRAVAPLEAPFAVVRLAGQGVVVGERHRLLPVRLRGEQDRRALADQLAGPRADHLLEEAVAALDRAGPYECDAHGSVVEDQLLLVERALDALLDCALDALQILLGAALLGDVLHHPYRALVRVPGVDRAAGDARPDGAAVLAPALLHAARDLAARERLVGGARAGVQRDVGIEQRGGLAVELARPVAVHLLVAPVAAHDAPVPDEYDAHRGASQDRLLLAQQPRHLVGLAALLGDVLDDPHRALLRVAGIEGLGDHAGEESRAVFAAHLPFEIELAAVVEEGHGDLAQRGIALGARIYDLARLADQLFGGVAEHFREARIAQEEVPVARERDADEGVGKQRLVLELRVAGAAGVARRRGFSGA